jgi:hypothetical protein
MEAAAGQLKSVATLAAAEIQDAVSRLQLKDALDQIHLGAGQLLIHDHIAIGFQVQPGEEAAPPFSGDMGFRILDWPQGLCL